MGVDFLLLRSFRRESALARVQSDPLFAGLDALGQVAPKCVYGAGANIDVPKPRYLIFHYSDDDSLLRARDIKASTGCKLVCFGADVYDLSHYAALSEMVDLFVVPTELHREVITPVVWGVEVRVLPEGVDPIALPSGGEVLPVQVNGSLCWFGYPESLHKSFSYILAPALEKSHFLTEHLAFITAPGVRLMEGVKHLEFHPDSFYRQTAEYGYSLLSHFTFDNHINTYIKSPNKLVTSLVRGMLPLVSHTRNYGALIEEYDLHPLAYRDGRELAMLLEKLDPQVDRGKIKGEAIARDLMARLAPEKIAGMFLNLL